jgi:hypothetical protein
VKLKFLFLLFVTVLNSSAYASTPEIDFSASELVFSGVQGQITVPDQTVTVLNSGTADLNVHTLSITGVDAADFVLLNAPAVPFTIGSSDTVVLTIRFAPRSMEIGVQSASLSIGSNDSDEGQVHLGLYGLSASGLEGGKEPSLHRVVTTLGYSINVGGTGLLLPTTPSPIGDEVLMPLMQKASPGLVTILPVARYSPHMPIPYGYYLPNTGNPIRQQVGVVSANVPYGQQYPPNHQTLNPRVDVGTAMTFDPGSETFGIYVYGLDARYTYTEDSLNATNPLLHGARIYPVKNRVGTPVPNTYLIAFEDASNGDYQDYVFLISNVMPPGGIIVPTNTPIPPTSTPAPIGGVELLSNTSFEIDANNDGLPDSWSFENLTNDARICGTSSAQEGSCAWNFISSANENAVISQIKNVPAAVDAGDVLSLNVFTRASNRAAGRIKVVIIYADTALGRDFIDLKLTPSASYQQVIGSIVLRGQVKRVRFLVRHRSTVAGVETWVDTASLKWQDTGGGTLPLPPASVFYPGK